MAAKRNPALEGLQRSIDRDVPVGYELAPVWTQEDPTDPAGLLQLYQMRAQDRIAAENAAAQQDYALNPVGLPNPDKHTSFNMLGLGESLRGTEHLRMGAGDDLMDTNRIRRTYGAQRKRGTIDRNRAYAVQAFRDL